MHAMALLERFGGTVVCTCRHCFGLTCDPWQSPESKESPMFATYKRIAHANRIPGIDGNVKVVSNPPTLTLGTLSRWVFSSLQRSTSSFLGRQQTR